MSNKSNIKIIAVLFILLVILLLAYSYKKTWFNQANTKTEEVQTVTLKNSQLVTKTYSSDKYGFSFQYPDNWTLYDNTKNRQDADLDLYLFPVPKGATWGDSYFSSVSVYEDVQDFDTWFKDREKTDKKITEYIKIVNEAYGQDYLKRDDITVIVSKTPIMGKPAIVQMERTRCPKTPNCYMLGWPQGYTKWVYIYNDPNVIEFFVTTYSENEATKMFDKVIETIKFKK